MIAAIVVLAGAVVALAVVTSVLVWSHQREREGWATERQALVNRAIARHSGEVIALDRQANKSPTDATPARRPVLVEGLS